MNLAHEIGKKDASRKGAKRAKFGKIFLPLRPWLSQHG
jgi:hypothetical protein